MKKLAQIIIEFLNRISTQPDQNSWKWGGSISFLSFVILKVIWLLRLFSILQFLKILVRRFLKFRKRYFKIPDSKRSDVPPFLQEIYFTLWSIFLIFIFYFGEDSIPFFTKREIIIKTISSYFLIESTVWLIYYTVMRRFFEERYSIYHPIEYFVLIPVIMLGQALAIAIAFDQQSVENAFLVLMGINDDESIPFYVKMIGVLYLAFVLSMIINGFPSEKRKSDSYYGIAIIGYGDVVKNRLLPALNRIFNKKNRIEIFTNDFENKRLRVYKISDIKNEVKNIIKSKVIFISTPSFSHFEYLEKLYTHNCFIVMEKPITTIKSELNIIKSLKSRGLLHNVFFLSYYQLEKSLPLTYLLNPSSFYEDYLNINTSKAKLFTNFENLGKLNEISVYLVEGNDNREWVEQDENGGHLLETFLHNIVIASQFTDSPSQWKNIEWSIQNPSDSKSKENIIMLDAISSETKIHLLMAKNIKKDKCYRGAKLLYEHGYIFANFDNKKLELVIDNKLMNTISIKDLYKKNYDTQINLALRCFENKIMPETLDGYDQQIDIIEWLITEKNSSRFNKSNKLKKSVMKGKNDLFNNSI